jgi:hypothetical protein
MGPSPLGTLPFSALNIYILLGVTFKNDKIVIYGFQIINSSGKTDDCYYIQDVLPYCIQ